VITTKSAVVRSAYISGRISAVWNCCQNVGGAHPLSPSRSVAAKVKACPGLTNIPTGKPVAGSIKTIAVQIYTLAKTLPRRNHPGDLV